jgi:nitroreductase
LIFSIQGGFRGYELPKQVIITTVDFSAYTGIGQNQMCYIDGGIYVSHLLLALEYEGIAACPLNNVMGNKNEKRLIQAINAGKFEKIAAIIPIGVFDEDNIVGKAPRVPVSERVKYIK